jgi:hypothetical protein
MLASLGYCGAGALGFWMLGCCSSRRSPAWNFWIGKCSELVVFGRASSGFSNILGAWGQDCWKILLLVEDIRLELLRSWLLEGAAHLGFLDAGKLMVL